MLRSSYVYSTAIKCPESYVPLSCHSLSLHGSYIFTNTPLNWFVFPTTILIGFKLDMMAVICYLSLHKILSGRLTLSDSLPSPSLSTGRFSNQDVQNIFSKYLFNQNLILKRYDIILKFFAVFFTKNFSDCFAAFSDHKKEF